MRLTVSDVVSLGNVIHVQLMVAARVSEHCITAVQQPSKLRVRVRFPLLAPQRRGGFLPHEGFRTFHLMPSPPRKK